VLIHLSPSTALYEFILAVATSLRAGAREADYGSPIGGFVAGHIWKDQVCLPAYTDCNFVEVIGKCINVQEKCSEVFNGSLGAAYTLVGWILTGVWLFIKSSALEKP
jgi:hypothetical protein